MEYLMDKAIVIAELLAERTPHNGAEAIDELLIPGVNLTPEEFHVEHDRTPPLARFQVTKLADLGVEHLLRLRMEFVALRHSEH